MREFLHACLFAQATALIDRETFWRVGGYDETLVRCQDYDLLLRLVRTGRVGYVDKPLYFYRKGRAGAQTQAHRRIIPWASLPG